MKCQELYLACIVMIYDKANRSVRGISDETRFYYEEDKDIYCHSIQVMANRVQTSFGSSKWICISLPGTYCFT